MSAAVLAPFESRVGPSDKDRVAWMAERNQGITATQIATLAAARNKDKAIADLVREKLTGGDPDLGHVPVIAWGHEREPALGDFAQFVHGYTPESRVVRAEGKPQYLASPDGWKLVKGAFGQDLHLVEFKTSGQRLTLAAAAKKGYVDQAQWQMYVCGAVHVDLIWEERLTNEDGSYSPGIRGIIPIERDDDRIGELLVLADRLLTALTAALVDGLSEDEGDPMFDDLLNRLDIAKESVKVYDAEVRDWMERGGVQAASTKNWNVSYAASKAPDLPDPDRFAAEHPDKAARIAEAEAEIEAIRLSYEPTIAAIEEEIKSLVEERATFTKPGNTPKPTLRITPKKAK